MNDISCKIKITIKDYYPKLKKIPYNDFVCLISYDNYNYNIPLNNIETIFSENEPEKINSDLIYNISLITNEDKSLISSSSLIIPYIRLIQIIKMKLIKYEQQIKFLLEDDIKEKYFGPGISVGSIFLKLSIEIIGIESEKSNIMRNDNLIQIRNFKTKSNFRNNTNLSLTVTNSFNVKNKTIKKMNGNTPTTSRFTTKNSKSNKSNEITNNCTSINRQKSNNDKEEYLYNQTSPFSLKKYNKTKSSKLINQKYIKNNYISSTQNIKKLFSNAIPSIKRNSNLKRYVTKTLYTSNNKKEIKNNNNKISLSNCFSDLSIRDKKKGLYAPKSQKRIIKTVFSLDNIRKDEAFNKENNKDCNNNNDDNILNQNDSIATNKSQNIKGKKIIEKMFK